MNMTSIIWYNCMKLYPACRIDYELMIPLNTYCDRLFPYNGRAINELPVSLVRSMNI